MYDHIKTEILEKEVQIIVERLTTMKPLFTSADITSFLKCKSCYQQVSDLRKRFYEILPVLQCRLDDAVLLQSAINAQKIALSIQGIPLPNAESGINSCFLSVSKEGSSSSLTSKPASFSENNTNKICYVTEAQQTSITEAYVNQSDAIEKLASLLKNVSKEVHNVTTAIEEKFFALEAEYNKKQMLEFITDTALKDILNGNALSSSITLNINGSITLEMFDCESDRSVSKSQKYVKKEKQTYLETEAQAESNEAENEEIQRRKDLFYVYFADTVLRFGDGKTLKVCLSFLLEKSSAFEIFLDRSKQVIVGYDFHKFKLFLDSLMEFQEITVDTALQIFPIACEFKVNKFVKKLISILNPVEVNENISLTLNAAVSNKKLELIRAVIDFMKKKGQIFAFFNEDRFYFKLEPGSVKELLNHFEIDSFLLKRIFLWGENYLKEQDRSIDIKSFFREFGIMDKLANALFETFGVRC